MLTLTYPPYTSHYPPYGDLHCSLCWNSYFGLQAEVKNEMSKQRGAGGTKL
jgi:hypothetical protein